MNIPFPTLISNFKKTKKCWFFRNCFFPWIFTLVTKVTFPWYSIHNIYIVVSQIADTKFVLYAVIYFSELILVIVHQWFRFLKDFSNLTYVMPHLAVILHILKFNLLIHIRQQIRFERLIVSFFNLKTLLWRSNNINPLFHRSHGFWNGSFKVLGSRDQITR